MVNLPSSSRMIELMKTNSSFTKGAFKDILSPLVEFNITGIITNSTVGKDNFLLSWSFGTQEQKIFKFLNMGIPLEYSNKSLSDYNLWKKQIEEKLKYLNLELFGFKKINELESNEMPKIQDNYSEVIKSNTFKLNFDITSLSEEAKLVILDVLKNKQAERKIEILTKFLKSEVIILDSQNILFETLSKRYCHLTYNESLKTLFSLPFKNFEIINIHSIKSRFNNHHYITGRHSDIGVFILTPEGKLLFSSSKEKVITQGYLYLEEKNHNGDILNINITSNFASIEFKNKTKILVNINKADSEGNKLDIIDCRESKNPIESLIWTKKPVILKGQSVKIHDYLYGTTKQTNGILQTTILQISDSKGLKATISPLLKSYSEIKFHQPNIQLSSNSWLGVIVAKDTLGVTDLYKVIDGEVSLICENIVLLAPLSPFTSKESPIIKLSSGEVHSLSNIGL